MQFFDVELIRKLDKKTRRRAVFHALLDSGILSARSVVVKLLMTAISLSVLFLGPLSIVSGAWIPVAIALPFLLSILLTTELESIFKPYLLKVALLLLHTEKVDA
ncbi:hypothetical protein [Marinomonas balearica]|nr:hypothetical protein [Marinomonas balearica]